MPSSRGSSPTRDGNPVSHISYIACIGSLPLVPCGKPKMHNTCYQKKKQLLNLIKHLDLTPNMKRERTESMLNNGLRIHTISKTLTVKTS